jgi:hypothetical protein
MASSLAMYMFIVFVSFIMPTQAADPFLARIPLELVPERLKQQLLVEIESVLGSDVRNGTEQRLGSIEAMLRPTFDALPKNAHGKLDGVSVRYALHRLFGQRHRWVMGGPAESAGHDSSVASQMLQERMPEIVQALFEQRTAADGSGLHDVALLAATLEHLVHAELRQKLEGIYQIRQMPLDALATMDQTKDFVDLYMMSFVRGLDLTTLTLDQIQWLESHIDKLYPPWEPAQKHWQENFLGADADITEQFSFDDVAAVLRGIGDRFPEWQDTQCHIMKDMMLEMEDRGSGRVKLIDFYNAAINEGKYQFTETINYLRQIGTLDESDPLNPRVIIPNYVSGLSNCVARTKYYSVCCLDECEALFGPLEKALRKPDATPDEIAHFVEQIASPTVPGNRRLTAVQRRRLDEMAKHHGGLIPLHGRLFGQWMHTVYPRECSYPHMSGTTYKKTMEQWEAETGEHSGSTLEEIVEWTARMEDTARLTELSEQQENGEEPHEEMHSMWTMDEELMIRAHSKLQGGTTHSSTGTAWCATGFTSIAFFVAVAALVFRLSGRTQSKFGKAGKAGVDKFVV